MGCCMNIKDISLGEQVIYQTLKGKMISVVAHHFPEDGSENFLFVVYDHPKAGTCIFPASLRRIKKIQGELF